MKVQLNKLEEEIRDGFTWSFILVIIHYTLNNIFSMVNPNWIIDDETAEKRDVSNGFWKRPSKRPDFFDIEINGDFWLVLLFIFMVICMIIWVCSLILAILSFYEALKIYRKNYSAKKYEQYKKQKFMDDFYELFKDNHSLYDYGSIEDLKELANKSKDIQRAIKNKKTLGD